MLFMIVSIHLHHRTHPLGAKGCLRWCRGILTMKSVASIKMLSIVSITCGDDAAHRKYEVSHFHRKYIPLHHRMILAIFFIVSILVHHRKKFLRWCTRMFTMKSIASTKKVLALFIVTMRAHRKYHMLFIVSITCFHRKYLPATASRCKYPRCSL